MDMPFFARKNNIKVYQKLFENGSAPIYLRTRSDRFVYRSAMLLSVFGLLVTSYSLYSMATGRLPPKSTK